jgi:nucleotidyltransferase substrate binding protein (TIGR01987 family)
MNDQQDIRWIQRFANFEKAFLLLQSALAVENPSIIERAGIVQFFEITFELSWKLLKDYEESAGFIIKTPRDAIKQAFQAGIVSDGHGWIDTLQDRSLTLHVYHEDMALEVDRKIRTQYLSLLNDLYQTFKTKRDQCPTDY